MEITKEERITSDGHSLQNQSHLDRLYNLTAITPEQKIKVFISSICGVEKYDAVRAELKRSIEATQLANVYTFEGKDASTLPAGAHYTFALEDSDICIFLIDNADGIQPGVQSEIDTVKRRGIKALYYFCDESQKEKTALEQSLMGAQFAKSKTIHSFNELSINGARALIDDIISVYHYYCTGRIILKTDESDEIQSVEISGTEKYQLPTIPKTAIKNVDKCRDYILHFVLGRSRDKYPDETVNTSEFDDWGLQFLPILFEGKTIKHFNSAMYLEALKAQQDGEFYKVVQTRWNAVQYYFAGENEKCIKSIEQALATAKETKQPSWIIKDILIDLRNQRLVWCTENNERFDLSAQKELNDSSEELYYPILDRIHESLQEKYIEGLYKKRIKSPYSVTFGNSFDQFGEMLASSFVVSMYNASLTHILLIYERIKKFVFYLSSKYDDWPFRLNLYKLAIFNGTEEEIRGLQNSYPEILNNLTSEEASSIMRFCLNHPIAYKRVSSQLRAFGAVGYYLDDNNFKQHEQLILSEIRLWLNCENAVVSIGQNVFKCLAGVAYRISQDTLSEICCLFIDRHYSQWYLDMFKFVANRIDLRKMSDESSKALVEHILSVFDNETDRKQISFAPFFLCVLRKQNTYLTEELDKKVSEHFPKYYESTYKLETTKNEKQDLPDFVEKYAESIKKSNETQGSNGVYFERGTREIATVRAIMLGNEIACEPETMDLLISSLSDTLLISKESISTKMDAISLLICIAIKFPGDFNRNRKVYEQLYEQQETIVEDDLSPFSSNIDSISLKIGLQFLYSAIDKDVYDTILELLPYIQGDIATTLTVARLISEYLASSDTVALPTKVESIVLQNVLQWLQSEHADIRWYATLIFLTMSRNPDNYGIVNRQLVKLIDSSSVYIKNLILRHLHKMNGVTDSTKNYIISKCKHDTNFVVRMVCAEVEKTWSGEE